MSESIYLMLGTDADKKRSSVILNEVSNAIYALDVVAQSVRPPPIAAHQTNATITIRIFHFHHNLFIF